MPRWLMVIAGLLITHSVAYWVGANREAVEAEATRAKGVLQAERVQQQVTQKIEQSHETQEDTVRTVFRDRIVYRNREVPREIVVRQDQACIIPGRFVSLWNSANRLQLPGAASLLDEAPSAVRLSDVEAEHEREAELYHTNAEQLDALQQWVQAQAAAAGTTVSRESASTSQTSTASSDPS